MMSHNVTIILALHDLLAAFDACQIAVTFICVWTQGRIDSCEPDTSLWCLQEGFIPFNLYLILSAWNHGICFFLALLKFVYDHSQKRE